MKFCRLGSANDPFFAEAFALYEESFPKREQRTLDRQTAVMAEPLYHFDVIAEDGAFAGILLWWECSGYAYIEHFAVLTSLRGRSIGSKALTEFCGGHSPVILEIDPPVDDISVRREGFYRRLGFISNACEHFHPPYHGQFPPHPLVVMSYPRALSEGEYGLFRRELSGTVMRDCAV